MMNEDVWQLTFCSVLTAATSYIVITSPAQISSLKTLKKTTPSPLPTWFAWNFLPISEEGQVP